MTAVGHILQQLQGAGAAIGIHAVENGNQDVLIRGAFLVVHQANEIIHGHSQRVHELLQGLVARIIRCAGCDFVDCALGYAAHGGQHVAGDALTLHDGANYFESHDDYLRYIPFVLAKVETQRSIRGIL